MKAAHTGEERKEQQTTQNDKGNDGEMNNASLSLPHKYLLRNQSLESCRSNHLWVKS